MMIDNSGRKMCTGSPTILPNLTNLFVSSAEEQCKVRAGSTLFVNSQTEIVSAQDFGVDYPQSTLHRLKIEICEVQSRLFPSGNLVNTSTWVKAISLAADHHCCNVELEAEKDGLVLSVKRTILTGEPLLMWFGERFRAMMDIPFLTGCHIEENLTYKCHICKQSFEGPNPLKLHIALKCDKLTINHLWQILAMKYAKPSFLMNNILHRSNALTFERFSNYQVSPPSLSYDLVPKLLNPLLSNGLESAFHLHRPIDISSAEFNESFRNLMGFSSPESRSAISTVSILEGQYKGKAEVLRKHFERIPRNSVDMVPEGETNLSSLGEFRGEEVDLSEGRRLIRDPLTLENEASSSGKTDDGNYQCIICHKRYSRKYGLKIHFRTHTGYKPLRCKFCGRAFGDPSNLNKHIRLHLNEENARYKCKHCDKGMVRRRDLERHVQKKHSMD